MRLGPGRRLTKKVALAALALALASLFAVGLSTAFSPAAHAAAQTSTTATTNPFQRMPVAGTLANRSGHQTGSFKGWLTVTSFSNNGSKLFANGTLTGAAYNRGGHVIRTVDTQVSIPVTSVDGRVLPQNATPGTVLPPLDPSCSILSLTLGAINLDLLGLVVTTNTINLNITAVSGAGQLLGNLLCDVANLLNPGGTLSTLLTNLTNTLNQILARL